MDGLVLVASRLDDRQILELTRTKDLVLVNRAVTDVPSIAPDIAPGLHAALDHLQELGHRSLAYLSGPPASWMNALRWDTLFELRRHLQRRHDQPEPHHHPQPARR